MDWRFFAATVFVCVAVGSFLYKRAQIEGVRPGSFMVVQTTCFLATVVVASLFDGGPRFDTPYLALGALCGLLGLTGAVSTLVSMKLGELGTNTAVVRLSFVPTTVGAVLFLQEPLTLRKGVLFVLAGLAVLLFADHYRRADRSAMASLVPALTACLAFGAFDLVYKYASMQGVPPLTFLIIQSGTANILIHIYVAVREKYQINGVILRIAPPCGVLFACACLAWINTLRSVDVSLVSPFIQMNFILSYLLGVVFLRESVTPRKIAGIGLVVLSIFLLSDGVLRGMLGLLGGV